MKHEEFEEKNFKADKTVIAFNSKYAQKMRFLNNTSNRKAKVIGLLKFLSADGRHPFSSSFTGRKNISVSDIYMAHSIVFMVQFENVRSNELIPLDDFLAANAPIIHHTPMNSYLLSHSK